MRTRKLFLNGSSLSMFDPSVSKVVTPDAEVRYSQMLTNVGLSSQVHFTSLSSSSIPSLEQHLSSHPSSSKGHAHTSPILTFISSSNPPIPQSKVCLLDPKAPKVLAPEDADAFDCFLYGGILGDDPPRDRTGELRKLGFEGRHLGPKQMTTDTAVAVTKMVVEDKGEVYAHLLLTWC